MKHDINNKYNQSPYREIPEELVDQYSMNGLVEIRSRSNYFDQSTPNLDFSNWDNILPGYIKMIGDRKEEKKLPYGYEEAATRVRLAMRYANLSNKKIAVVGSIRPWIEAIGIKFQCKITTVEYNLPEINTHPDIHTITWDDFVLENEKYDAVISYSSIEHSGLGRYGDPLNPNEDLHVTSIIRSKIKPSGIFILAVPYHPTKDILNWNAHRTYGPNRWPLLTKGFTIKNKFVSENPKSGQPVFVLQLEE